MAITRHETQVTWNSGSNSATCPTAGSVISDAITLDETCFQAQIHFKADNQGTPDADDQVLMWLLNSGGDPDGSATAEYDSDLGGLRLAVMDTAGNNPFQRTADLPVPQKTLQIRADGEEYTTTQAIVVSATITEQRSG